MKKLIFNILICNTTAGGFQYAIILIYWILLIERNNLHLLLLCCIKINNDKFLYCDGYRFGVSPGFQGHEKWCALMDSFEDWNGI